MNIDIPCGRGVVGITVPDGQMEKVAILESKQAPPLPDARAALEAALEKPTAGPALAELVRGKKSACVVVSDITRPVPNPVILPPLLEALERAGMKRENMYILIATGMHRPNEGDELAELLGPEIADRYRVINHFCQDRERLRKIAEIDGAAIEINIDYLDADLKILTGLIEPHPFAGFSGGGKSILPGVAGFQTMTFMHSYKLVAHPGVATGRIGDNPFRGYIDRVVDAAGADFLLNVLINKRRDIVGVFSGEVKRAFDEGCRMASEISIARVHEPADVAITCGGGYPLDATLYQSSKGLAEAKKMVRPGGTVVWIAECAQGLGSGHFCDLVESVSCAEDFELKYSDPARTVIDQWGAQVYFQALAHIGRILLYSPHVSAEQAAKFGIAKIEDLDSTVGNLIAENKRIIIAPEGPYVGCLTS